MSSNARPRHSRRSGETLEVEIEKSVNRGFGLARIDGVVCLVRGAYPGERWRVVITSTGRSHVEATGRDLLRPHPGRRASPCPVFPDCGGCAHLDLDQETQREIKLSALAETLSRAGVGWSGPTEIAASPPTGWRTRATLHVGEDDAGGAVLGLRRSGGHDIVVAGACLQLSAAANMVVQGLRRLLVSAPDRTGLEGVALAESMTGDQLVVTFEGQISRGLASYLRQRALDVPGITGAGIATPRSGWRRLGGGAFLEHQVGALALRAHARSFFQSNRYLVGALVEEVERHVTEGAPVLDLYSGVGLFALALARSGHAVTAVEGNPLAVADGRENARTAGYDQGQVKVIGRPVESFLGWPAERSGEAIVVDPPRSGLGQALSRAIAARRPAVLVYVSCDPATLARDLSVLRASGLDVVSLRAFDLFPGTFHVETVAALMPGR